ncbi:MAG: GH1 family beta-glucosidase, partial [Acidobacteriota bacterium]
WHRFSHSAGRVRNGETGDIACDHYRRYREDVALMREIGLDAYRFSFSWSRVFPEGTGRVNAAGLDFYNRLVDTLLKAGIEPVATLYHWDLPAALDDRGGWLNRDVASWFADYALEMFRTFDDRIRMWATLNEPWVVTDGGYLHGVLAPGHASEWETPRAAHNLLRAHGEAVSAYRSVGKNRIGIVVNLEPKHPASDSAEDAQASRRSDAYMNKQYLDPIFKGAYPDELPELFGEAWPHFPAEDLQVISQPIDFLGINYYKRGVMKNAPEAPVERASHVTRIIGRTYTTVGWEVYPPGLTEILVWVRDRYGDLPLYVTENGAAFYDPPVAEGGAVHDPLRVSYLRHHLRAIHDAMDQGVNLCGYFVWSLMDNFEWSHGYSPRFGLVHVNFETQERTLKDSADFYREVIRTRGKILEQGS